MNKRRGVFRGAAWSLALMGVALALASWLSAVPRGMNPPSERPMTPPSQTAHERPRMVESAAILVSRNPFRTARSPTQVRFGDEPVAVYETEQVDAVLRPTLRLGGIIGGPPWAALLEGVPGHEGGLLLMQGVEAGDLVFRELRGDTVILAAFDSIWHLTPKPTWQ